MTDAREIIANTHVPDEAALNVKTRCGHSIVLPHGVSERVPTCPDCRAKHATEDGE